MTWVPTLFKYKEMLYGIIDDDAKSLWSFSFMKSDAESSSLTLEMMKKKRITRTWKHIDETSRKLKCLNAWDHHHLIRCKFMVLFVVEESHISRIVLHSISIWLALPMEYPTKHGSLSLSLFSEFLFHDKTHFIKRIEKWYYDLIYL